MLLKNFDLSSFLLYFLMACIEVYFVYASYRSKNVKYIKIKKLKINLYILICWLLLTLFASVRFVSDGGIGGADAGYYIKQFLEYNGDLFYFVDWAKIKSFNVREPLYYLSIHIIRAFSSDYHIWFFLLYGIIAASFLYFIRSFLEYDSVFMVVVISFCNYLHSFNVMRNWIGIAIFLVATVRLSKGKDWQFILLVLVAAGFHYSALAMLLFYICYKIIEIIPAKRINLILFSIGINLISIPASAMYAYLFANNKFRFYIGMKSSGFGYITTFFIWIIGLIFYKQLISRNKINLLILVGLTFNIGCMYLIINMGMYRINDFFSLFKMYILSESICVLKENYSSIIKRPMIIGLYIFTILYSLQLLLNYIETSKIMPYIFGGL